MNMDNIIELIKKIRKAKLENNIKDNYIFFTNEILINNQNIIDKLLKNKALENYQKLDSINFNFMGSVVTLYYDNSVNKTAEIERLYKEKERLEMSINRREKLLSNQNYINKAPKNIIQNERENLKKEIQELEIINQKLK